MTPVPPPPGPPPRRRAALRRVLIIVAVVVAVCCAGGIAAGYGLVHWGNSAAGPARDATGTFLTRLEKGDTTGAYQLLCADERNRLSQAAFADQVHAQPPLRNHTIVDVSVAVVNGTSTALVTVDLTRDGAAVERHTVRLVKDGSSWRVCGEPY
jgi:uncharacterized membrane protein